MISITLKEMVKKAKEAEMDEERIKFISGFENIDEFLSYEEATHWLYWYAENVIKGRWPEAEEYIMKDPIIA